MKGSGLRGRLALAFAATALVSVLLTAGGAALLVERSAQERALGVLKRQLDVLAGTLPAGGGPSGEPRLFVLRDGRPVPRGPRSPLARAVAARPPGPGAARGRIDVGARELLYVQAVPPGGAPVLLARAPRAADPDLGPFLDALLVAAAVAGAVALLAGLLLARGLTRPLRALTDASARVRAGAAGTTVAVDRDDELGELGRAFNAMSEELAEARAAQRGFLRSVSHELKTPLTALRAQGEALADGALDGRTAGPVIAGDAERLDRLVRDLLSLADLERPGFTVAAEAIDLGAVADAVRARHAAQAAALGVELRREGAARARARGDPGRLEQAASNLVENALRVTPAGGHVALAVAERELVVRDTGPGLRPDELARAFERFYLHERYRSDRPMGSGLGLALVRERLEAMGGRAEVESRPGQGATFRLRLPA